MDEPSIAERIAALPGPVQTLFRMGQPTWPAAADAWPDYASKGLTAVHADVLAGLIQREWFAYLPWEDDRGEGVATGWAGLHVPRALVAVAGARALPALFDGARLNVFEDAFGDFYTAEGGQWVDACGEEGAHTCAQLAGRADNTWLEESLALGGVERWIKANPGQTAEALLKKTVRRVTAAMTDTDAADTEPNGFRIDFLAEMRVASALPAIETAWAEGGFELHDCGAFTDILARLEGRDPEREREQRADRPAAAAKPPNAAAARAAKKKVRQRKRKKR